MIISNGRVESAGNREEILDEQNLSHAFGLPIRLLRNKAGRYWAMLE